VTRLPRITGRELIAGLRRAGFEVARIKGSHHFLRHADGRGTVVPVHSGETIGPGLLAAILRDCEIAPDVFIAML
jgi:predicted RNA binding protein YcfA (HicA-like mRNA interferase family)